MHGEPAKQRLRHPCWLSVKHRSKTLFDCVHSDMITNEWIQVPSIYTTIFLYQQPTIDRLVLFLLNHVYSENSINGAPFLQIPVSFWHQHPSCKYCAGVLWNIPFKQNSHYKLSLLFRPHWVIASVSASTLARNLSSAFLEATILSDCR